jgi:hypothetical protein
MTINLARYLAPHLILRVRRVYHDRRGVHVHFAVLRKGDLDAYIIVNMASADERLALAKQLRELRHPDAIPVDESDMLALLQDITEYPDFETPLHPRSPLPVYKILPLVWRNGEPERLDTAPAAIPQEATA